MRDNPYGVPHATIDEMEATLPGEVVAQVIYGVFVDASGLVFHADYLNRMFYGSELNVETWEMPGLTVPDPKLTDYGLPLGRKYVVAADLARKNDYTVLYVFDITLTPHKPAQLVYYRRLNRVSWESIYAEIARAAVRFHAEALLDATGMGGDVVVDELENRFYCPQCHLTVPYTLTHGGRICPKCHLEGRRFEVAGFQFQGRTKEQAITRMQQAMAYGQGLRDDWGLLRMPRLRQVQDELTFYRLDDKDLETDTVMALALVAEQLDFDEQGIAVGSVHG
jgi:hypothetical protein